MEVIGENVDRLITVEMKPGGQTPTRGKTKRLYEAALSIYSARSLTLLAAQKIIDQLKENDNVFILTGCASLPFLPHGETDGPLGAASIARALSLGLKVHPLFIVEEKDINAIKYTAKAIGLNVESYEIMKEARSAATIITYPGRGDVDVRHIAKNMIDEYKPKALFAFEVMGPNSKGFCHTVLGYDVTYKVPEFYHLFDEANINGILTIAGIDGGNELGSGSIEKQVREIMPYGNMCQCSCRSGNACHVKAEVVIPATTSNWAAYGISAMLAFLLKNVDLLQDTDTEKRMLEACFMAGAVDGYTMAPQMSVDGTSEKANHCIVGLLREIINNGLIEEFVRLKLRV